jgi:hypothetical protein
MEPGVGGAGGALASHGDAGGSVPGAGADASVVEPVADAAPTSRMDAGQPPRMDASRPPRMDAGAPPRDAAGADGPMAGGSQDAGVHVVRACPSGMGAVGQWENVTPPAIKVPVPSCGSQPCNFGTQAVIVNPLDPATIYVGGDHQGIFRSKDCGATWTKINTGRNGAILDTGLAWSMAIDPVNPNVIYTVNGYGKELGLWKTTNGGVDWDQLFPPSSEVAKTVAYNFASIVSMDPTDHNHLVVGFHNGCSGAYAPGCLAESRDAGATWRLVRLPPAGAEAAGPMVIDADRWLYGIPFTGLWLTQDRGATWTQVAKDGGYSHYRAQDGTHYVGGIHGMIHSPDGVHWTTTPSPSITGLTGDGKRMFGGVQQCGGGHCYYTSPESDGVTWTELPSPVSGQGGYLLAYDKDHHILYSTNQTQGLWRVVTY